MTTVVGGLRTRYIRDSAEVEVKRILTALGWFGSGRQHQPVVVLPKPKKWDEPVGPNTLAVSLAGLTDAEAEMGSNATDDTHTAYIDFYAEDDAVGEHLIGDLYDALRGKMPSISRGRPIIDVLNFGAVGHPVLFTCHIERVVKDRADNFPHPWQQFWYIIRFELLDEVYGGEG